MYADSRDAQPICGGTDLMVSINFDRARPAALIDLSRLENLASWQLVDSGAGVRIGAGMTYTRIINELAGPCPALAIAARTVGSPQIRNKGTIGGNLATASPAGDCHPVLLAVRATVEVESAHSVRMIPIDDFFLGPKCSALQPDELIRAVRVPVAVGPQQFAKIGPRNAMVIAVTSFAVAIDADSRRVGTGIGSAGPTPLRADAAEALIESAFEAAPRMLDDATAEEFGRLVSAAASPIDDVRGQATYRRHALAVLAKRCLRWAWGELEGSNCR